MNSRPKLVPNSDHPISVEPTQARVVVTTGGKVIADSRRALTLREANYPAVQYIPREDVDMTLLQPTTHQTYCPYKGECSYFSIPQGGDRATNAVWSYEAPYAAVSAIEGHLAFYPTRVDSIDLRQGEPAP